MKILKFISLFIILFQLASCSGNRPENLGVQNGRLLPCPDRPNCASSQETKDPHKVDPIQMEGDLAISKAKLKKVLSSIGRNRIILEKEDYMHVEFTSSIFRFVDDVEFYFDVKNNVIDMRSSSRIGHYDLGVNKERLNKINFEFVQM